MSFLIKIIIHIIANSGAIWTADYLIKDFVFQGSWQNLIIAGIFLGLINSLIKPILKILTFPIIILTLGLFTVIINIFLIILAAKFIPGLEILSLWGAFWGTIVISLANYLILTIFRQK